jgi:Raf kinase inhibitor-like YbhB/YbcL family protein
VVGVGERVSAASVCRVPTRGRNSLSNGGGRLTHEVFAVRGDLERSVPGHDWNEVSEDMTTAEPTAEETIVVTSPAFGDGKPIPPEYTCRGAGQPPPLAWRGVPAEATSLALVVSDPDAPVGTFIHWVVYDLPAGDGELTAEMMPAGVREGDNSAGGKGWYPPCPPSGKHRYRFTIFALAQRVREAGARDILDDLARSAIARGTLTGLVRAS